ncbi:MAG: hypothetical protein WCJ19_04690 [bacterium]
MYKIIKTKKQFITILIIISIIITLFSYFIINKKKEIITYSYQSKILAKWDRNAFNCQLTNNFSHYKLTLYNSIETSLLEICNTMSNKKIASEIGSFINIKKADELDQNLLKNNSKSYLNVYTNLSISIITNAKTNDIIEIALGEGATQRIFWNFDKNNFEKEIGATNLQYSFKGAEIPFTQYVYPKYGISFQSYDDDGSIISLNLFTPVTEEEYLKYNELGSNNQLYINYAYHTVVK